MPDPVPDPRADVALWRPHLEAILRRHDLEANGREVRAGFNPTNPTFVCGDVVVKLFGGDPAWPRRHAGEQAALRRVAVHDRLPAPIVLAEGRLRADDDAPWPYLVTDRVAGTSLRDAHASREERHELAAALGRLVRRIHALPIDGIVAASNWLDRPIADAASRSSLPPHLVDQVEAFTADLEPVDPVFVHGDLCAMHVFVDDGRVAGLIDWGDAVIADPHYELIQLYRDTFACDPSLFRAFLEAYDWPIAADFPERTLGFALLRQATGLAQHRGMDVFEPIAEALPLDRVDTLEELASTLFDV